MSVCYVSILYDRITDLTMDLKNAQNLIDKTVSKLEEVEEDLARIEDELSASNQTASVLRRDCHRVQTGWNRLFEELRSVKKRFRAVCEHVNRNKITDTERFVWVALAYSYGMPGKKNLLQDVQGGVAMVLADVVAIVSLRVGASSSA